MRGAISILFAAVSLITSCQAADVSGDRGDAAAPLTMRLAGQGDRPIAPSLLEFVHVEGPAADSSNKTYIQVARSDPWSRTFGNVTFGMDDPFVTGITGDPSLPLRITIRSSLVRATSSADVIEKLLQFGRDLNIAGLGPTARALVFLTPARVDFDSAVSDPKNAAVPGLDQFTLLTPQCAYARLRTNDAQRQAAVLIVHVPDLSLSLDDPSDRKCVEGFFARNLGLSEAAVHDLIFSSGTASQPDCDIARILRPSRWNDADQISTAGCPIAPVRRAATLIAYARMQGAGLAPAQAAKIIERTKQSCERQIRTGEVMDESCRSVLPGVN